jgi:hypothetical protein
MSKTLIIIILTLFSITVHAQSWEIGGFGGGAGYMGDLNPNNPLKISGIAVGGFVKRNFDGYFSAKLAYTYGVIGAADSNSSNQQFRNRNLSFKDHLNEVSLTAEYNFMKYIPSVSQNYYTPFIFAGIAYTGYNPTTVYQGQTYDLRYLQTEGQPTPYANSTWALPYGVGIKYNVTGKWNLIADIGYRIAYTDYLDDVSGYYPDKSKLPSTLSAALSDRSGERTGNYIGTPNTQRGDLRPRDTYLFVGFSISYTFVTSKCYY